MSPIRTLRSASGIFAFALAGMIASATTWATVVRVPGLDEMVKLSDVVVHAVVKDQRVVTQGGRQATLTSLEVIEGVKGRHAGDIVTVFQNGALVDGKGSWIAGQHQFRFGDELVLFGVKYGREHVVSLGVGVGVFAVSRKNGESTIVEQLGDVAVVAQDGRSTLHAPQPRSNSSLEAFMWQISVFAAPGPDQSADRATR